MTTESFWSRLCRGSRWLWHRPDWERFVGPDWPERIMTVEVTDRFHAKQGRSTGRWLLEADGQRLAVYLKRHYELPRWHGWLAALWLRRAWSPAMQEWRNLEWARSAGFPVPAAVAAGEFLGPWGRLSSFLAVEELTDMLPLNEAIPLAGSRLGPAEFAHWKRTLVGEVARLARGLHGRRAFHKDLYLCHFYVPRDDTGRLPEWRDRVHLIDLHRLGRHPLTWPLWLVKDLAQLLYSSEVVGVTARDRLRFWRAYRDGRRGGLGTWFLRLLVAWKGQLYRRHNARPRSSASGVPA